MNREHHLEINHRENSLGIQTANCHYLSSYRYSCCYEKQYVALILKKNFLKCWFYVIPKSDIYCKLSTSKRTRHYNVVVVMAIAAFLYQEKCEKIRENFNKNSSALLYVLGAMKHTSEHPFRI